MHRTPRSALGPGASTRWFRSRRRQAPRTWSATRGMCRCGVGQSLARPIPAPVRTSACLDPAFETRDADHSRRWRRPRIGLLESLAAHRMDGRLGKPRRLLLGPGSSIRATWICRPGPSSIDVRGRIRRRHFRAIGSGAPCWWQSRPIHGGDNGLSPDSSAYDFLVAGS